MKRFANAALVTALVFLPAIGTAQTVVSTADDVCPPTADPCNVTTQLDVAAGAELDFGSRELRITGNGQLDTGDQSATIRAGEFTMDVGNNIGLKVRGPNGFGGIDGGNLNMSIQRRCSIDNDTECVNDGQCDFGACVRNACSLDTDRECFSDPGCDLGTCSAFVCSGRQNVTCAEDNDCFFGTCNISTRSCSNNPQIVCFNNTQCNYGSCLVNSPRCSEDTTQTCAQDSDCFLGLCDVDVCNRRERDGTNRTCEEDSDCFDGECSVGTGNAVLNGRIRADGTSPGSVTIRAAGAVTVTQSIDLDSSNTDNDGGTLELQAGTGSVTVDAIIEATGGGLSQGGEVCLVAGEDVVINSNINVEGGDFDGGFIEIDAGRDVLVNANLFASSVNGGGVGGEVAIQAQGDITTTGAVEISTRGHRSAADAFAGDGGPQDYSAGGDIVISSSTNMQADGAEPDGFGDAIAFDAAGNIDIGGDLSAKARGNEGAGGEIEIDAGGDVILRETSRLVVSGSDAGGGSVSILGDGSAILDGVIDGRASNGGGADSVVVDMETDVTMSGTILIEGEPPGQIMVNGSVDIAACRLVFAAGADISNQGDFGDNFFTARERFQASGGAVISTAGSGTNTIRYRTDDKPPILSGSIFPTPSLIVDETLPGCPVCGNGELEGGESCDDGNTDNGDGCSDSCQNEGCLAQTPDFPNVPLCDDGDGCTVDECDVENSTCMNTLSCDDGIDCTVDTCEGQTCVNEPSDTLCDDDNVCTDDICGTGSGCGYVSNTGRSCDDALDCTVNDVCDQGQCAGISTCAGGEICTESGCASAETCGDGEVTESEQCDDGDAVWTSGEFCDAGCQLVGCGDTDDNTLITASDALFIIRTAVGLGVCDDCICNVNGAGGTNASDALLALNVAVGIPGFSVACPACP